MSSSGTAGVSLRDPAGGVSHFGAIQQFFVSCLWFAYNAQWGALLAVVLPRQVEAIAGAADKYWVNGVVGPLGAFVALVVTPIAGALSDRSSHRWGRRKPYLLVGVAINVVFLLWASTCSRPGDLWPFVLAVMGIQLGCNWWGGPYAGLIPDVVPAERRGQASAWMAVMSALGAIVGALAAGQLVAGGDFRAVYVAIAAVLILFLGLTWFGIREKPRPASSAIPRARSSPREFIASFWIDPRQHGDFYWVLATRALVMLGVYSVFSFFQYFLADVLRAPNPAEASSYLVGIITLACIPSAAWAGGLSDRWGRKALVYLSGGVMAVASAVFVAAIVWPSMTLVYAVALVFGLGYGAYQAVDWALAIDVLPRSKENGAGHARDMAEDASPDAAKDMGIWHVALVLPQMIGPLVTGSVLSSFKATTLTGGYAVVFGLATLWVLAGTVLVRKVRGVS